MPSQELGEVRVPGKLGAKKRECWPRKYKARVVNMVAWAYMPPTMGHESPSDLLELVWMTVQ